MKNAPVAGTPFCGSVPDKPIGSKSTAPTLLRRVHCTTRVKLLLFVVEPLTALTVTL
jgi:hypothetical protein